MKTTHELMGPTVHVVPGPEGSTRLSLVEAPVTITTLLTRDAARSAWRAFARVLGETDHQADHWTLGELHRFRGALKDSKADLTEYRAEMLEIVDKYMSMIETTMRDQS